MAGVGTLPLEAAARWGGLLAPRNSFSSLVSVLWHLACLDHTCAGGLLALGGDHEHACVEQMAANAARLELATRRAAAEALPLLPLAGGGLPKWHAEERRYVTPRGGCPGVGVCEWDALQLPLRTGRRADDLPRSPPPPRCALTISPRRSGSVDVCVVDLPFGMACKVKGGLRICYPRSVLQMARVLRPGGRLVMLSPSRQLLLHVLQQQAPLWKEERRLDVNCGGQLACITLWRRTSTTADMPRTLPGALNGLPEDDPDSQAPPGAVDAGRAPSLLQLIMQCDAPGAMCEALPACTIL